MKYLIIAGFWTLLSCSSPVESPTVLKEYAEPASPEEVAEFIRNAAELSPSVIAEVFGHSAEGNELLVVKYKSGKKQESLRVMVLAQQHGNEQSGKEACMLLIRDLAAGRLESLYENLELWIVPQANPEGGRFDQRRNSKGYDLNRDHVVMQTPEVRSLHALFRSFLPHVTIDIHEYYPYSESWKEFGGYKNFDLQVGVPTNLNVGERIRKFALEKALPVIETHLTQKGFSFHNYLVGPVPAQGRTRHSTVDIDDGRHGFAILGSLSFIFEGLNGKNGSPDNLERRTTAQYEGLRGLLQFVTENQREILEMVEKERTKMVAGDLPAEVHIRMEHFPDGRDLTLPLTSSKTGRDTSVAIMNHHPEVRSLLKIRRPSAYLVPAGDSLLTAFLENHGIIYELCPPLENEEITGYFIEKIEVSIDEELENFYPVAVNRKLPIEVLGREYFLVPVTQLHANFLSLVFEPQSMLGLFQRPGYEYLLKEKEIFPILRMEKTD